MIDPTETRLPVVSTTKGEVLAYALRRRSSEVGMTLSGLICLGLGAYWTFRHFTETGRQRTSLEPVWLMLMGLAFALWQLWIDRQFKHPAVEVSHHPLEPGTRVEFLVTQEGPATIANLSAKLACRRSEQRTNDSKRTTELDEIFLFDSCDVQVSAETPWRTRLTVEIPDDATGSSERANVRVRWFVEVTAKGRSRWPKVSTFEVLMAWRVMETLPDVAGT